MIKKKAKKVSKKSAANAARSRAMKALWDKKASKVFPAVTEPKENVITVAGLSAQDVKDLVTICADKNIMSFQYGDLRLRFNKTPSDTTTERTEQRTAAANNALRKVKSVPGVTNRMELEEAADMATEELEHLKITDPAAYEAFISSEDVADDGSDGN